MIENQFIVSSVKEKIGNKLLKTEVLSGMLSITIEAGANGEVLQFMKETPGLDFGFLTDLCGVHYPDEKLPFAVIYHLHNMREQTRVRIKLFLPAEKPEVRTVTNLFSAANWMERETFDFYGIVFTGHPNLVRILNVEYMDYFPMRKEYPLEDPTREDKDNRFFGREAGQ